jgi:hypothetical protein
VEQSVNSNLKENKTLMRKETVRGKNITLREEMKIEIRRKGKKELRIESNYRNQINH